MQFRLLKVGDARDYILAAVLLLLAVSMAVSRNQGGINSLRQFSVTIVSVLQTPLSSARVYRQALNTNTFLQRQNILLQDELSRLRAIEQENTQLRNLLDYKNRSPFDLKSVTIIGKELAGLNNSLTVDAGTSSGVEPGMPLVSSNGLLGTVVVANDNFAQVMPYYNSLFRASARIQENQAVGIVSWEGNNMSELVMNFVPKTIRIDSGYVVETSGFSNQFPGGIPIGYVYKTEAVEGRETQKIYLRPYTSLFDVSKGFVIQFQPDSSLSDLEKSFNQFFE